MVNEKITIVHIITGLSVRGGAEISLMRLVTHMSRSQFTNYVICLGKKGEIGMFLERQSIEVFELGMGSMLSVPKKCAQLASLMKRLRPNVVQTWMYHSDLVGGLIAKISRKAPVVWNIRNTDYTKIKKKTYFIAKLCAKLSSIVPEKIVTCSYASRDTHIALGYNIGRFEVIPNGFETEKFVADEYVKSEARSKYGIGKDKKVVGIVGRYDIQKDYGTFLKAFAIVERNIRNAIAVFIGDGLEAENTDLMKLIDDAGLKDSVLLLGRQSDIHKIYPVLDVLVSTSTGEGFSNVIGEAMLCEVICVVTNVGDSKLIVGDCGRVLEPRDFRGIANEIVSVLGMNEAERREVGKMARMHIKTNYSIMTATRKYEELYSLVLHGDEK